MLDILSKSFRSAFGNKLRSALTAAGIAVGVASVVLVSSIGNIGKETINRELTGMGMDSLVISAYGLDTSDLKAVSESENVSDAMPLMNNISTVTLCGKNSSAMVWGVNENADKVIELDVLWGRLIGRGDVAEHKNVCVVDEAAA